MDIWMLLSLPFYGFITVSTIFIGVCFYQYISEEDERIYLANIPEKIRKIKKELGVD